MTDTHFQSEKILVQLVECFLLALLQPIPDGQTLR